MPRLKAPQRKEQLLQVATKLFAKYGYEATTTASIAQAAGVTEPILYRHFENKQDLFVEIVRQVSDETMRHWQELVGDSEDPEEQFRLIAGEFPAHISQLADQYHVLHGALSTLGSDRKVRAVINEHYTQIETFFVKLVQNGQKSGVFRKNLDPRVFAWQLIMTGIGYAMIALNLSQFDESLIRSAIDSVMRGLKA